MTTGNQWGSKVHAPPFAWVFYWVGEGHLHHNFSRVKAWHPGDNSKEATSSCLLVSSENRVPLQSHASPSFSQLKCELNIWRVYPIFKHTHVAITLTFNSGFLVKTLRLQTYEQADPTWALTWVMPLGSPNKNNTIFHITPICFQLSFSKKLDWDHRQPGMDI